MSSGKIRGCIDYNADKISQNISRSIRYLGLSTRSPRLRRICHDAPFQENITSPVFSINKVIEDYVRRPVNTGAGPAEKRSGDSEGNCLS
jgi:hypothetical protein